ncbi:MAG: hypothetical protein GPOALKHO_000364 [Sodalis sp.]|nr:MAG: hypothetical protein GPOALKHO_000364 [Sodalis sp.]
MHFITTKRCCGIDSNGIAPLHPMAESYRFICEPCLRRLMRRGWWQLNPRRSRLRLGRHQSMVMRRLIINKCDADPRHRLS